MQTSKWALMYFGLGIFGCGGGASDPALGKEATDLFVQDGVALWNGASSARPELLGGGATIPVCFAVRPILTGGTTLCPNMTDATKDCDGNTTNTTVDPNGPVVLNQAVLRPFIRGVMEDTWSRAANVEFTGFGDCAVGASGKHEDALNAGKVMILFTTQDVSGLGMPTSGPNIVSYNWAWLMRLATNNPGPATLFNTIHEFGHVLGFSHEWARADFSLPSGCSRDAGEGVVAGYDLTPASDPDSIMDKCDPLTYQNLLSPGDNWGVQMAYGPRVKGILPLATAWNGSRNDHNTVADATSRADSVSSGYAWTYAEGWLFRSQAPQTVPLKHYWHPGRLDNFVTATTAGSNDAVAAGYTFIRTEGYVYSTQQPGTVPLKLYYSAARNDNLTTSNPTAQAAAQQAGYTFIRTEGYVFNDLPYTVGRSYWNASLGDNVSTASDGALVKQIRGSGWVSMGADAAYMNNQLPGTVAAKTYFSSSRGDYETAALSTDQNNAIAAGYTFKQTEGYLFSSQYNAQDAAPMTLFWHSGRADNFTTYSGAQVAVASGYVTMNVQGYGLSPFHDAAGRTLYNAWDTLPGGALDIGVANDTAWIIGTNNTIFKWDPVASTWVQSSGSASRIAVQPDGVPWVVDASGLIYQRNTNSATSGVWVQRAGCAVDVGVGLDGSVWIVGCSPTGHGYGTFKWVGSSWVMDTTGVGGTRIAVDSSGTPWLVDGIGQIFKRSSADPTSGSWTLVPGGARDIGVGAAGYPWIVGTSAVSGGFSIFARDDQLGTWVSVPGGALQIAVGRNARPWTTDSSGVIRRAAD